MSAKKIGGFLLLLLGVGVLAMLVGAGTFRCGSFGRFLEEPLHCSRDWPTVTWLVVPLMLALGGGSIWDARRSTRGGPET